MSTLPLLVFLDFRDVKNFELCSYQMLRQLLQYVEAVSDVVVIPPTARITALA